MLGQFDFTACCIANTISKAEDGGFTASFQFGSWPDRGIPSARPDIISGKSHILFPDGIIQKRADKYVEPPTGGLRVGI